MYLLILLTFVFSGLQSQQLIDGKKGVAIASGKATAIKDAEFIIKGDKLIWYINEVNEKMNVKKILGFTNVSIRTNNEVAFSDKALYN